MPSTRTAPLTRKLVGRGQAASMQQGKANQEKARENGRKVASKAVDEEAAEARIEELKAEAVARAAGTKLVKRTGFQLTEAEAAGATVSRTTAEWDCPPVEALAKIDAHLNTLTEKGRRTAAHSVRRAIVALIEAGAPEAEPKPAMTRAQKDEAFFAAAIDVLNGADPIVTADALVEAAGPVEELADPDPEGRLENAEGPEMGEAPHEPASYDDRADEVPATVESWYGMKDGKFVACYPNRAAADAALDRPFAQRTVDSVSPSKAAEDKVVRVALAKLEHKMLQVWIKAGELPPRPTTPNLDALEAENTYRPAATAPAASTSSKTARHLEAIARRKAEGKRGAGTKISAEELTAYVAKVRAEQPDATERGELEYAYWIERLAVNDKSWAAAWAAAQAAAA